jgi:putative serine protease PepD
MDTMTNPPLFPTFEVPEESTPAEPPPAEPPGPPPAAPWRPSGRARQGTALLALALVAGAAGGALTHAVDGRGSTTAGAVRSVLPTRASSKLAGKPLDVAGIISAVEPAVVTIQVNLGGRGPFSATGAGTGVILTATGDVLTNAHVVDGASQIEVTLSGESQARTARVVGTDTSADVALIHIDGASGLPVAQLGSSGAVQVGDDVVAIGNALALKGGLTVTKGIISALDRSLDGNNATMTGLMQTDASISSGNSGGPLVNAAGQVIGINTAVATSSRNQAAENIGFAIPIDKALPVVERLRNGTTAPAAAYLGVRTSDPTDGSRGASIMSVEAGSPASTAGLRIGDLITKVAGKVVAGAAELSGIMTEHKPGERVDVTVIRNGTPIDIAVALGTRSPA